MAASDRDRDPRPARADGATSPATFRVPGVAAGGPISYAIFRAARAHRVVAADLLRRTGLYAGQELLLMQLWERDHQPQSNLVKSLRLDASTVTKMVQRLEQQGFIARYEDPTDRRAVVVALTPRGAALRCAVAELWAELEVATTAGMSDRQRVETLQVLERIEANMTRIQLGEDPDARGSSTTTSA